uniref:Uncharacterized protein n=1 Tax=Pithovirus LCPAC304 TaxID=2506594 RepID=A0A481Z846_9VIRU|nr:MAG: hypothetical protein LCPAC304_01240 [Pithovirus LCPAC304]
MRKTYCRKIETGKSAFELDHDISTLRALITSLQKRVHVIEKELSFVPEIGETYFKAKKDFDEKAEPKDPNV